MPEPRDERQEGHQNPMVHTGAEPDAADTDADADDKVEILDPDGTEAPRAGEDR